MRTTVRQILKLAWILWRHPDRRYLRITQMICEGIGSGTMFYMENEKFIRSIRDGSK